MKIACRLLLVLMISVFLFSCGGKKAGIEGKLIDGQGQPLSGITVIMKQVQPVKGYEQFETKTGSDGIFRLSGFMSSSDYIIMPVSDKWTTKTSLKINTGSGGQTLVLSNPIVVRFNLLANGTVIDTKTGLQWLIYTVTDLNAGNVLKTVRNIKEGGFNDWRLPSKAELLGLQEKMASAAAPSEGESVRESCCVWAAEPHSEKVEWEFYVDDGNDLWTSSTMPPNDRIVIVRASGANAPIVTAQAPTAAPSAVVVPSPAAVSPAPAGTTAPSAKKEVATTPEPQKAEPAKVAPEEKVAAVPTSNTVILHFGINKAAISAADLAELKAFYAKVKGTPGKIVIEGHADAGGDAADNLRISVNRAVNTLAMLKRIGLSNKVKVELKGLGDTKPTAANDSEEGRKLNRRAEVTFIP